MDNVTQSTFIRNMTNSTAAPFIKPFGEVGIAFVATTLITFLVVCIILNAITMSVILKNPSLRKDKFMLLIFSLCCSDMLSACISWIWLHRRTWGFDDFAPVPAFFCKIYWGGDIMTNYVTATHILVFACMRFTAIKFPMSFKRLKRKTLKGMIITIWVVCFGVGFIPMVLWFNAKKRDRTSDLPDARWPACTLNADYFPEYTMYVNIAYPVLLYIPVIGVVLMSLLITGLVYYHLFHGKVKQSAKNRRKDKQSIIQLLLIAFCFIIGYVPFTAYEIWAVIKWPNTPYYAALDYWFGTAGYIAIRFSETMNPIFYNIGSPKMRAHTFKLLKKTFNVETVEMKSVSQVSKSTRVSGTTSGLASSTSAAETD